MKVITMTLLMVVVLIGCSQPKKQSKPIAKYCMELKLVDGTMIKDTFNLIVGTEFEIGQYKGAYGLGITTDCYFKLYKYNYRLPGTGFLRFGIIDYRIDTIIPLAR